MITAGNHTFRRKESYDLFDSCETLLRPANFPSLAPGRGYCVVDMGRIQVGILNLMGVVYMESMDSVSYTHLDVYKRQEYDWCWTACLTTVAIPMPGLTGTIVARGELVTTPNHPGAVSYTHLQGVRQRRSATQCDFEPGL